MPTPDILAVSAQFEAQLDAGFAQAATTMTAQYDQVLRGMDATVQALQKEYAARAAAGETIKPWMIAQDARYRELMAQVQTQLAKLSNSGSQAIEGLQRDGIATGMDTAEAQVNALVPPGVSIPFNRLPTGAIESMVGFLQDGSPLKALLDDIAKDATRDIGNLLVRAIAEGWNPRKTAAAIKQAVGVPLTRALRIARTEQLRAWRTASVRGYRDQGALIIGYRRHADKDTRTCFACLMQDGKMYRLEEDFTDHIQGRCHPGGVFVSGPTPIVAASRYYSGKLVTIRTASGIELSFTPNHPILTFGGWVAGGLLNEGDYVVCGSFSEHGAATVNKDDYHVPTLIEKVVETLGAITAEVPCTAENFNGDGKGSEVYVVRANGLLGNDVQATAFEPVSQHDFGLRGMRLSGLAGGCDVALMLKGMSDAAGCCVGDSHASAVLGHGSLFGKESVGVGLAAAFGSGLAQTNLDDTARHAKAFGEGGFGCPCTVQAGDFFDRKTELLPPGGRCLLDSEMIPQRLISEQATGFEFGAQAHFTDMESSRDIFGTFAGDVSVDRILEVSSRAFSGHVYSLQTKEEWYIASDSIAHNDAAHKYRGIVAHNCAVIPVTRSWKDLGFPDIPDTNAKWQPGKDWFLQQSAATQREILGPARFGAWQRGEVGLDDMQTLHKSQKWGDSWQVASLKQAKANAGQP